MNHRRNAEGFQISSVHRLAQPAEPRLVPPGLADNYLEFLKSKPTNRNKTKTLAPMTIRKRLQFAKMIFRAAERHLLIDSNPFAEVRIKAKKTAGRDRFITKFVDTLYRMVFLSVKLWMVMFQMSR